MAKEGNTLLSISTSKMYYSTLAKCSIPLLVRENVCENILGIKDTSVYFIYYDTLIALFFTCHL